MMKRFWKRSRQLQQCRSLVHVQPVSGPERSNFRLNAVCVRLDRGEGLPACMSEAHACPIARERQQQSTEEKRDQKRYKYNKVICILPILTHCIRLPIQFSYILYIQTNSLSFFRKSFKETRPLFDQSVTHHHSASNCLPQKAQPAFIHLFPHGSTRQKQGKGGIDAIFCATLND